MKIRKATFKDLRKVLDIYDEGYLEVKENPNFGDYLRLTPPDEKRKKAWIKNQHKYLLNGDIVFSVAEEAGNIVGFCYVIKKDLPDSEMSHVGVLAIRVSKGWRNKGIGTKLLDYTLNGCHGKFDIIELFPFANNIIAKNLYKKFNLKPWGTAPGYIKRNGIYIDLEYMCLDLREKSRTK